jgi:glycosyltransferase involved in cell wall biosynthesis
VQPLRSSAALRACEGGTNLQGIYLSGAPRLSTRPDTESIGPRSHILGVIGAFAELGIPLERFIVGDTAPSALHSPGSEKRLTASWASVLAADVLRFFYRIKSQAQLRRRAKISKFDFAYERYALYQELGSVARKHGAHWILEVNALLALESTSDRRATTSRVIATRFERRTLRSADTIVAVTQALATQIALTYDIDAGKILVISNGVDHTKHKKVVRRPVTGRAVRIGFVGTLYSWQNVDSLLTEIKSLNSTAVTLEIVGDGPERGALEAAVDAHGLGQQVTFLGRMNPDGVPDFLASVDLCFAGHGSVNGAYFSPLKLWEYLAAGKPVLASAHEATLALASEGFPVVCFEGKTEQPLGLALRDTLLRIDELQALAESRQQSVWRDYSWTARITPLLEIVKTA